MKNSDFRILWGQNDCSAGKACFFHMSYLGLVFDTPNVPSLWVLLGIIPAYRASNMPWAAPGVTKNILYANAVLRE